MPDRARPQRLRRLSRRRALRLLAAGGAGLLLAACGAPRRDAPAATVADERAPEAARVVLPPPTATPTPRPVPPAGHVERTLLPGTEWATPLVAIHSGVEGPRVMVLGGVHGNEPGGWQAAEAIAAWEVQAGSLLVIPRANVLATDAFARTLPELGDLNRLYPGSPDATLPMARMAAAIVDAARDFEAELLLDLHESWGFYAERTQGGTAFLGQTVTVGVGPIAPDSIHAVADEVNARLTEREQLIVRDRSEFLRLRQDPSLPPQVVEWYFRRGGSSLSLGNHVPGLTPVLIEMGQQDQPEARRVELHRMVVRAALERRRML